MSEIIWRKDVALGDIWHCFRSGEEVRHGGRGFREVYWDGGDSQFCEECYRKEILEKEVACEPTTVVRTKDLVAATIAKDLGVTERMTREFIREVLEDILLFDRKQHDYGSENISDFGELGVLVRANDKIARLKNLLAKEGSELHSQPENESIDDSWRDLSVYGVIARLVRKGVWK